MVDMNESKLWPKGSKCYECFKVVEDKNDFGWWALTFRYYEQLRAMVDMKDSGIWAHAFRCYTHLRVVDDMKDSRSGVQSLIRAQLVSQLIRVQLVLLDWGSNRQNL